MCKNSEPWVFTLPEDFSWDSGFTVPGEWVVREKTGAVRRILRLSVRVTVTRCYAWAGWRRGRERAQRRTRPAIFMRDLRVFWASFTEEERAGSLQWRTDRRRSGRGLRRPVSSRNLLAASASSGLLESRMPDHTEGVA